jgi:DNA-binding response OmpR family regulator
MPEHLPPVDASGAVGAKPWAHLDVLVVDDEFATRAGLCAAVIRLGNNCRGVARGLEALEAHNERRADVIVSDWRMPGIDGMELCRRVRALDVGTYTYLLFTSGHASKRDFVDAVRAGADDYLPKPVDLDDLEARLIAAARVVCAYRQLAERNVVLRHDSQAFFRAALASIDSTGEGSARDGIALVDKALYLAKADGGNRIRDASGLK